MIGTCARIVAFVGLLAGITPVAQAWDDRPGELYTLCKSCHGADNLGIEAVGAPAIAGLPEWYLQAQLEKFSNGVRGGHVKDINGMRMRPIGRTLTEANRQQMARYVSAMARPDSPETVKGNLAKGEMTYQVCQACHGAKGEGNQQVFAPPIAGASDWYLLTQLKNFKNKIRGYDPTVDPNGAAMQGIAATLDDAAMVNVVAYINALKPTK